MGTKTPEEAWNGWTPKDIKRHLVSVYKLTDGTYEAFAGKAQIPDGAEHLKPQPKRPTSGDPHEGTRVAMKKLESEHAWEVSWGCHVAVEIARKNMTVHSREVRRELETRGILGPDGGKEHWLGAVFHRLKADKILEATSQFYRYSDAERGIHERKVTIWQLVEGADCSKYLTAPPATRE